MKKTTFAHGSAKALALTGVASVLALAAGQASAHIGYGADLNTVAGQATANLNTTVTSNMGFIGGSQSAFLGDSHNTRARWFTLTEPQRVNFTITGTNTNGNGVLNPAFSLYKEANGAAPFASEHDGYGDLINAGNYAATSAAGKAYLNSQAGFASWSPFAIANPAIDLAKAELGGAPRTDPNWGIFDANGDFTACNNNGQCNTWDYQSSGTSPSNSSVSYSGILQPGTYSIFIGGDDQSDYESLLAAYQGGDTTAVAALRLARTASISFSTTAVPVPAAVWLFGSALAGMGIIGRRKQAQA